MASTICTSDFCCNQQYSVTAITTAAGAIAERYAYTAYGLPTILNASATIIATSAISNRYTYTGREWDATLALHHFRARWMSPIAGRFLSRDPIVYEGSEWGLYHFGNGSALNALDPSGLVCLAPCKQANRRSRRQCCQAAKAIPNFDGGYRGLTFCCDGQVVACVWPSRVIDDVGNLNARRIILNCIHKHEENHVPDVRTCPDICPDLRYGQPVDGYSQEMSECLALKRHIRCLIPGLRRCGNDLSCKDEVSREITDIFNKMRVWCRAAGINGGVPGVYE